MNQVSLELHHEDSLLLLRRAVESAHAFNATSAILAEGAAERWTVQKMPAEAARHLRRAAEFNRRADLLLQLSDQLPATDSPLPLAPMGTP